MFEQHATLFFAAVAVIGGVSGYTGAAIHRLREGRRWKHSR